MFSDNCLYWIWLSLALGQGSGKVNDVIEHFGSAENFYKASEKSMELAGVFNRSCIEKVKSVSLDSAKKVAQACQKDGQSVLCYGDENYPALLGNIFCPPVVLYIKGSLFDMDNEVGISIVGTRKCSAYGYEAAQLLSRRLAEAGAVIISGCAQGIDTAAHEGCLDVQGKTVAALACGIDVRYNMVNAQLREEIAQKGALISEYPPGTEVRRYHFHARNRIIAALGRGTVVVEAGERSGALITANHASEQGKDIFALPGNLKSPYSVGSNRLIRDGAYPVECPLDILGQYAPFFPHKLKLEGSEQPLFTGTVQNDAAIVKKKREKTEKPPQKQEKTAPLSLEGVSEEGRLVAGCFGGLSLNTDDIMESTALSTGKILRALTELELFGIVQSLPGGRYKLME